MLISATLALIVILLITYILNVIENKNVITIPIVTKDIDQGSALTYIDYVEVNLNGINKSVLENIINKEELKKLVANISLLKGEILLKDKTVSKEEYLTRVENLEFVSLPIKSGEGVTSKLKKGDKINVYYTAKRKSVEGIIKSKIKVYSSNKEETTVTCLLYQNVEVLSITNNLGVEVTDGTGTNILVRLKGEEVLELANLKEQGIFTYSLI